MRRFALLALVLALPACGSDGADTGPVRFGIVAGDGQFVTAGQDSLIEPVIGQAYRDASGAITFRFVKPLHAQTTIGTGVPDVLTCAEAIGEYGLEPWQSCRQTDSEGFVTYWFEPGTVAGDACAEIRATPDGTPEVLATTCATVEPGPAATWHFQLNGSGLPTTVRPGDTLDARLLVRSVLDAYGNTVPVDNVRTMPDSTVTLYWLDRADDFQVVVTDTGWAAVVPDREHFSDPRGDGSRFPGLSMEIAGIAETSGNIAVLEMPPE